ncbi:MAG: hypothetical protein KatS3mg096_713 [Candidatus Parcubacteria bacterium]|nr:MAG: hypothetical protein KatS3mg096_713 [Candidatus Parcubacteria bacterium]
MKKKIIIPIVLVFFINFIYASIGVYKQGQNINLVQTCSDCTYINITSIIAPNGTKLVGNVPMTKDGSVFNYTLDGSLTKQIGTYKVTGIGDPAGVNEVWSYTFEVSYFGQELKTSQAIIYSIGFFVILFLFVLNLFYILKLPSSNYKDGEFLGISYLKYVRQVLIFVEYLFVIALLYISSNVSFAYLNDQLMGKFLFTLFRIFLGFLPLGVIMWFILIFIKIKEDRELKKMIERGLFNQRI